MDPPRRIIRRFDAPDHVYAAGHRGVDIEGHGLAVKAVENGTVRFAGQVAGRRVISIMHRDGLISTYEPVSASVIPGQVVSAGEQIGTLGPEAGPARCPDGWCLHLGARIGEKTYIDPLTLLAALQPSVLLPLEGHAPIPVPPGGIDRGYDSSQDLFNLGFGYGYNLPHWSDRLADRPLNQPESVPTNNASSTSPTVKITRKGVVTGRYVIAEMLD
ncbi:M23 family metallopeptidase [Devriesea agamarum]|uniref:M23 family metallopeptidase n=1 Tax=Devriesea agamarum TaxID=472569 RepID=UPI00155F17D0|nr:M23 family metallopeptidase [Devriesea agamarum]